jgi:hypothetical protein
MNATQAVWHKDGSAVTRLAGPYNLDLQPRGARSNPGQWKVVQRAVFPAAHVRPSSYLGVRQGFRTVVGFKKD